MWKVERYNKHGGIEKGKYRVDLPFMNNCIVVCQLILNNDHALYVNYLKQGWSDCFQK